MKKIFKANARDVAYKEGMFELHHPANVNHNFLPASSCSSAIDNNLKITGNIIYSYNVCGL